MFGFRGFVTCSLCCVLFSSIGSFAVAALNTDIKSNYTILEHKSLSIICNATEGEDIEIYWTKNQTKSKFFQSGINLTFSDITRMDAGDYVCHALNTTIPGDNVTSSNYTVEVVNIDVQYAAEIAGFDMYPDTVMENQSFSVQCNFMGNPEPTWEVRNNYTKQAYVKVCNIASNSTRSGIVAVCGEFGYIECTGYNKLSRGINATQGKNLKVMCSPRPNPKVEIQNKITAFIGSQAFLLVNVIGYPYPSYSWSRVDGKPMPECTQIDYPVVTGLKITNVTLEDFGFYAVTMNNSLGAHTTTIELRAFGHPQPPHNLTYFNVTYYSVSLSWVSGYDMGSKQHFVIIKQLEDGSYIQTYVVRGDYENHGVNKTWTTTLYGLDSDTEYTLTIQAANEYGLKTLAKTKVSFRTHVNPYIEYHHSHHIDVALVAGSVGGGLAFIGCLAFVVYMLKYRRMRMSYDNMDKRGGR